MNSDNKPAAAIGGVANSLVQELKKIQHLGHETIRQGIEQAGGPKTFLGSTYPLLADTASDALSADGLTSLMPADLKDAERRLQDCAKCHFGLGVCSYDYSGHKRGQQPSYETGRLVFSGCANWPEHKMRSRIQGAGVPLKLSGSAYKGVQERLPENHDHGIDSFQNFVRSCRSGAPRSLVVVGPSASEVSVAALRAVIASRPQLTLRFERASALKLPMKKFYADTKLPDPLEPLTHVDVAVLDDVNPGDPSWLLDALSELTYARFLEEKVTIVGVPRGDAKRESERFFQETVNLCLTHAAKR